MTAKPSPFAPPIREGSALRAVLRLRCPYCGRGHVIKAHFQVHERCDTCGFRFCRDGDPSYFGGASFVNYMVSGGFGVTTLVLTAILAWPNVPWDMLSFVLPALTLGVAAAFYPMSKVIWLAVDVAIRPVARTEIDLPGSAQPSGAS